MKIEITNIEQYSAIAKITEINTSYTNRRLEFYFNGNYVKELSLDDGKASISVKLSFENAGTEYEINVKLYGYISGLGDGYIDSTAISFETKPDSSEPEEPEEPEEDPSWKLAWDNDKSDISSTIEDSYELNEYEILRIKVTFNKSGNVQFKTIGASGARIYLSKQSAINEDDGTPATDPLIKDSSKSGNVDFEYSVFAGEVYYFFIRHYYGTDEGEITYQIVIPEKTRPSTFKWTNPKEQGKEFNLTAKEWNDLCQNVNDLLAYCDQWDYPFAEAIKGYSFTAKMFNDVLEAIKPISKRTVEELESYMVQAGTIVKAQALNDLIALVNEIQ